MEFSKKHIQVTWGHWDQSTIQRDGTLIEKSSPIPPYRRKLLGSQGILFGIYFLFFPDFTI